MKFGRSWSEIDRKLKKQFYKFFEQTHFSKYQKSKFPKNTKTFKNPSISSKFQETSLPKSPNLNPNPIPNFKNSNNTPTQIADHIRTLTVAILDGASIARDDPYVFAVKHKECDLELMEVGFILFYWLTNGVLIGITFCLLKVLKCPKKFFSKKIGK